MKYEADIATGPETNEKLKRLGATIVLIFALTFYSYSVLRVDFDQTRLLDLHPQPDSVEYFAAAVNLYQKGSYTIQIGENDYPPRYPFGYSLLMLPIIHLTGIENAILAPFRVNQITGLLLIFALFCYFYFNRRPVAAAVSVAILTTMPGFVIFARSSLSELVGAGLVLLAHCLSAEGLKRDKTFYFHLAAIVIGLATCVRLQLMFYSPLMLSVFLLSGKISLKKRLRSVAISCGLFLLTTSPIFIYNFLWFNTPLKTGYHFWVPHYETLSNVFSPQFFWGQINALWREFSLSETGYSSANIFGPGSFFTPLFFVLSLAAVTLYPKSKQKLFLILPGFFFTGITLFYFFISVRLYFTIAILMVPLIAVSSEKCLVGITGWKTLAPRIVYLFLLTAVIGGFPSQAGPYHKFTPFHSVELLKMKGYMGRGSSAYELVQTFRSNFDRYKPLVLTSLSPVFVKSLLGPGTTCIPNSEDHQYKYTTKFRFRGDDIASAIETARKGNRRIFHLALKPVNDEEIDDLIPTPAGYQWKRVPFYKLRGSIFEMKISQAGG